MLSVSFSSYLSSKGTMSGHLHPEKLRMEGSFRHDLFTALVFIHLLDQQIESYAKM